MTNQPIHILNQMGVITAFSVAKKITEDDINKFYIHQKRVGKKESEIENMLKQKILADIEEAIKNNKIPGLLSPQELASQLGFDKNIVANMPELNRIIMVIAHKLSEKKYDKMSLCYFVNSLVNILGLTEKNFEKFHQQNDTGENTDDDDGDDDDEDDDDGDTKTND